MDQSTDGRQFTRRREDFDCAACGRHVTGNGYTNHCPACLWSRHVDVSPGDRSATCRGMMRPIGVLYEGGELQVVHRCEECPHMRRNRVAATDDSATVHSLVGNMIQWPEKPRRR